MLFDETYRGEKTLSLAGRMVP
jgi:hypothetical protein